MEFRIFKVVNGHVNNKHHPNVTTSRILQACKEAGLVFNNLLEVGNVTVPCGHHHIPIDLEGTDEL